jgi:uncharacterized protein YfaS (alpha-2-macroglobulin family)
VKQRDWQGKLDGLPIEVEVIDARGTSVQARKIALPEMGFAETSYSTAYESPTGVYQIAAYVVRNGKRDLQLGSTSVTVKEFLPDRMKIESHLSKESDPGWVTPEGIRAKVSLAESLRNTGYRPRIESSRRPDARRIPLRPIRGLPVLRSSAG